MGHSRALNILEPAHVANARRIATDFAHASGFGEARTGDVAIVATELATNLLKHATGGELHLSLPEEADLGGVELLSIDRGPGMANADACFRDGFSTAGTSGTGLGAVVRLSSEFDIYSQEGQGTLLISRIWPGAAKQSVHHLIFGGVQLPKAGESVCGDAWGVLRENNRTTFIVADGLGHGVLAHDASDQARDILRRSSGMTPQFLLERIHRALRGTRGAAVAIAQVVDGEAEVRFAGVGNISSCIVVGQDVRHMVSHNGTAGQQVRQIQEFRYGYPTGSTLLMYSDGLTSHWRLDAYPGIQVRHPALLACALYRDSSRGRDDVTVIAAKRT